MYLSLKYIPDFIASLNELLPKPYLEQENGLSFEGWKATSNFQRIILWISGILTFA